MLLDEPVAGLNNEESMTMLNQIRSIHGRGITIMLVEHDMKVVMNLCTRIVVLNFGKKIADDVPEKIVQNQQVIDSYLGSEEIDQYAS